MKPEWKQFVEKQKPAEKPLARPVKRFVELPGGVQKRESGRHSGPLAEKGKEKGLGGDITFEEAKRFQDKVLTSKFPRKSSGYHVAELPPVQDNLASQESIVQHPEILEKTSEKKEGKPKDKINTMAGQLPEIQKEREEEIARIRRITRRPRK